MNNKKWRNVGLYALLAVVLGLVTLNLFNGGSPTPKQMSYSELLHRVESRQVSQVVLENGSLAIVKLEPNNEERRVELPVPLPDDFSQTLLDNNVLFDVKPVQKDSPLLRILGQLFIPLLIIGFLFFLVRRAQSGPGNQAMNFGKSRARVQMEPKTQITFSDVAGIEQAKLELAEVVDFLKNSERFTIVGAKIPKGVLLVGPPGTGKTLLARAVAGEAGVPFFSISGSEFVEMFVGVGASRVRDLFEQAKQNAPCIVFIDEIDAVGRQRGAGLGGGNDEREQTLNQLLTEMDGFEGNSGVIVIAATNRPDVLDQALMRPGRFDRQVTVDRPDYSGRREILQVHARGKTLGKDLDLEKIARRTPGFTGADLANLLNEAAILAARRNLNEISMDEINDAVDRVLVGPEKKERLLSDRRKRLVAFHEAGHALVGALMPNYDSVQKVTIIPRGQAGGLTWFMPSDDDIGLMTRSHLLNMMTVALGGRVAEEVVFGDAEVTTGAASDLQQVTRIARNMVMRFGMSDRIGNVALGRQSGNPFMGREIASERDYSDETAAAVDAEIRRLVDLAYQKCHKTIEQNRELLTRIAERLVDVETIDGDEFQTMINSSPVVMPAPEPEPALA
ncbi:ATP-dependent zinc metalloprotease FtsH [Synechococcus sp. PCC 7336]|uniref:ATP-dependent zinc metalloprotease FtsH n=1 Tax=Synechococcus sp. PCC 7336 TaxID=195250 RepID=UPI0003452E97|nr:ATP-dependent zinc metalloprotease FtsH [Synechococcus sp. PCC 7336]